MKKTNNAVFAFGRKKACELLPVTETGDAPEKKMYYVYILSNQSNSVLYVGMTNDLERRLYQHRSGATEGFTKKYRVHKLVFYEVCFDVRDAIAREKQIKRWSRQKKIDLVSSFNREWKELFTERKDK